MADTVFKALKQAGIRVELDDRDNKNPGDKYSHWEQRGVPIRLEIGQKDFEKSEVRCCKRNDGKKSQIACEGIDKSMEKLLGEIHHEMFDKALKARQEKTKDVDNWKDFMDAMAEKNLANAPWCNVQQCEIDVKERSKEESLKAMEETNAEEAQLTGSAKTLCIPFEQPVLKEGQKCFACDKDAKCTALWGRSY